jgi:hypothetical protein
MAKIRPAGKGRARTQAADKRGLFSCIFLLIMGFGLVAFLFWAVMRSGN